ncbi:hypothetical protein ACFC25_04255 [Pseudarthrobacter sp. NPDC055928]|uniref:hypothetical protein n=1 Tax=Pseudarthrobacter sp. NPDC055928 TaxID=3345661 RepID=UPI0035DB566A
MAREHARIQTAIWIDDDFLDLTREAQHLYFVMTTQMTLNFCGVTTWHAGRISQLAADWTVAEVEEAAEELSEHLYLVIDETTGEVLVRSFIRNDGLLSSPNITKAMYRTYSDIGSRTLRSVVVHELKRLHTEQPLLKGWDCCGDLLTKRSNDPSELTPYKANRNPSETPSKPFPAAVGNPSHAPYSLLPTPNSHTPDSPQRSSYPPDFETLWNLYPLKRDKKAAYKAYVKASKEVEKEALREGVVRYRDDPNRKPQFTKHFSTWLNAGSWDDEPLPAPDLGNQRMDHSARGLAKGMALLQEYDAQQQQDQPFLEIEG